VWRDEANEVVVGESDLASRRLLVAYKQAAADVVVAFVKGRESRKKSSVPPDPDDKFLFSAQTRYGSRPS